MRKLQISEISFHFIKFRKFAVKLLLLECKHLLKTCPQKPPSGIEIGQVVTELFKFKVVYFFLHTLYILMKVLHTKWKYTLMSPGFHFVRVFAYIILANLMEIVSVLSVHFHIACKYYVHFYWYLYKIKIHTNELELNKTLLLVYVYWAKLY